jgi:L-alanine-DL-glutamate epimerase-like enolase superfamily enzyme
MAAAKDLPVVPHGNDLHNLHLVFSQINTPFTEYFPQVWDGANTHFWDIYEGNPVQKNGHISLSTEPGLGYKLKESAVAKILLERS